MAEVEIIVTGKNLAKAAFASLFGDTTAAKVNTEELALAMRRAALAAQTAGDAAAKGMRVAADAADRAAVAQKAAADGADRLAKGEITEAEAAKLNERAQRAQVTAMDAAAASSRTLERSQLVQAESARKAGLAQLEAASAMKKSAAETSAWSKLGGVASAAWTTMKWSMLGVAGAAVYGVDKAAKFNASITQLSTQAGVSKDKLAGLSTGVLKLAGQVGFSPTSLAEALYHVESNFESMGITSAKALELTKVAAEGAAVGKSDLVDTTNALTAAVASGIPGAQDFTAAMGALNSTVGTGDMKMQDLAQAFSGGMVAVVKGYGLSIRDVGAALATFGDNNIRGAEAGTQLRMSVQALAVPAKGGAAALAHLGMTTRTLADDMKKGGLKLAMEDLIHRFRAAGISAKDQGQVITEIFGKKAGAGVAVLAGQFDRLMSKYPAQEAAAKGFGKSWEETQRTASAGFARMKNTFEALAITLGTAMLPAVNAIGNALTKALADPAVSKALTDFGTYLGKVLQAATPLLPIIMKLADQLMQALGPALPPIASALVKVGAALGTSLGKVIQQLAPYLPKLAKAFGDVALALIPMIPAVANIVIAFMPLIPSVARAVEVFAKLLAKAAEFIAWWDGIATPALHAVTKLFDDVTKGIWNVWKWLYDELIGHSIIPDMINGMTSWFRRGVDGVRKAVSWFTGLPGMFSRWMGGAVSAIGRGIGSAVGWFKGLPGKIVGALGNVGSLLYSSGQRIISGLINGISSMLGALTSTASNIAGKIAGFFPHSPAKEGPLSGGGSPEKSGATIVDMLAGGMTSRTSAAATAAAQVAGAAASGLRSSSHHPRHPRHHKPPRLNINQQLDHIAHNEGHMSTHAVDAAIEKIMRAHRFTVAQLERATQILFVKGGHRTSTSSIDQLVTTMKQHYKGLTSVEILKTAIAELAKHPHLSPSALMADVVKALHAQPRTTKKGGSGSGSGASAGYVSDLTWRAGGVQYTVGGAGRATGPGGTAAGATGGSTGVGAGQQLTIVFGTLRVEFDLKGSGSAEDRELIEKLRKSIRVRGGNVQKVLGH